MEIVCNVIAGGKYWTTDRILREVVSRKPDWRLSLDERPRKFSACRSTTAEKRNSWVGCRHLVNDALNTLIASGHVERAPTGRYFESKIGKTVHAKCYKLIKPYRPPVAAETAEPATVAAVTRKLRMRHLPQWVQDMV
jgi:hypothetical protein